jgi:hypothetical protein
MAHADIEHILAHRLRGRVKPGIRTEAPYVQDESEARFQTRRGGLRMAVRKLRTKAKGPLAHPYWVEDDT